jgi:hypothetical protein
MDKGSAQEEAPMLWCVDAHKSWLGEHRPSGPRIDKQNLLKEEVSVNSNGEVV